MKTVLLLLPVASYRNEDFMNAADALGVRVIAVADNCPQLAPSWGMGPLSAVHFDQPEIAAQTILENLNCKPDALIAVDDHGLELAAILRERLGLPGNPVAAVGLTRDKLAFRHLQRRHDFLCPAFLNVGHDLPEPEIRAMAARLQYPLVVKARRLSASRGVVRVDQAADFVSAVRWVREIQGRQDRASHELGLVVESFIPGKEYALEGILHAGKLQVLALFDKPDPLDGPYFEETIYVTPSRLPQAMQDKIAEQVEVICAQAGLQTGPVHAEMRINEQGVWLLEVASRSIGGLCGRMLRHALGMPLEEVVLRHALGLPVPDAQQRGASAVMMLPIPRRGIYRGVRGLDAAMAKPFIKSVLITAEVGALLLPPPEGASYLGFIFAQADEPRAAELAVRQAHQCLQFEIQPDMPVASCGA